MGSSPEELETTSKATVHGARQQTFHKRRPHAPLPRSRRESSAYHPLPKNKNVLLEPHRKNMSTQKNPGLFFQKESQEKVLLPGPPFSFRSVSQNVSVPPRRGRGSNGITVINSSSARGAALSSTRMICCFHKREGKMRMERVRKREGGNA